MKNAILMFIVALCLQPSSAQTDLISAFNSTHSGRSIIISGSKTFNNRNEIGIGARLNINKLAHNDDQNNSYRKRLYATEFSERLGLEAFYQRKFLMNWQNVRPFFFYDIQATHSGTRNRMFLPVMPHDTYGTLYDEVIEFFGPYTWIEQTVGFGFKAQLNKQFYIYQKLGGGVTFILGACRTYFLH